MARKVITQLTSDLSGVEADETVTFSIDGSFYRIDLTTDEAREFRDHLTNYSTKGERVSKRNAVKQIRPASSSAKREERSHIRSWARSNGYEIGDRGRISKEISDAYDNAHS